MVKHYVVQAWDKAEAIRKTRRKYPKYVVVNALIVRPSLKTFKVLLKPRKKRKK